MPDTNKKITRRRFLFLSAGQLVFLSGCSLQKKRSFVSARQRFEQEIDFILQRFMGERRIPGGAIAINYNKRLVFAKGYGWSNIGHRERVTQNTLFRIASLSKPITALAVLKCIQSGKLSLQTRPFEVLGLMPLKPEMQVDPRLYEITVFQLLQHTGGWDSNLSGFDPMFAQKDIAAFAGVTSPPDKDTIIRYMLGRRLDFDPGTRYAYSNFGYLVLGRLIEKIYCISYGTFVKQYILQPLGVMQMYLGYSFWEQRYVGESTYYDEHMVSSVFDYRPGRVKFPYGGFCLENMDSHGGWVASVVELSKLSSYFTPPYIDDDLVKMMTMPPPPPAWRDRNGRLSDYYYSCGWLVRPIAGGNSYNLWHTGSLPGSFGIWVRRHDLVSWIALFNKRSQDQQKPDEVIDGEVNHIIDLFLDGVTNAF